MPVNKKVKLTKEILEQNISPQVDMEEVHHILRKHKPKPKHYEHPFDEDIQQPETLPRKYTKLWYVRLYAVDIGQFAVTVHDAEKTKKKELKKRVSRDDRVYVFGPMPNFGEWVSSMLPVLKYDEHNCYQTYHARRKDMVLKAGYPNFEYLPNIKYVFSIR